MDLRDQIWALRDRERHYPTSVNLQTRCQKHVRQRIATLALENRTSEAEILRVLMHLGFEQLGIDGLAMPGAPQKVGAEQ
jgi:hypothetical protein